MSRENVELLKAATEGSRAGMPELDWEGHGFTGWLAGLHDPEVEWDCSTHPIPDLAGVYSGRKAVLQWWRDWLAAWETVDFEYQLVDAGDRVVGLYDMRMRGRSTSIEVSSGKFAIVFTFTNGLIVHARFCPSWSEALEAVELS